MKGYKLNQAYIDRQTDLVKKYGGDLKETLKLAKERLNEQAEGIKGWMAVWAATNMGIDNVMATLVDWNNHTLANHPEIVQELYMEAQKRVNVERNTVIYRREPTDTIEIPAFKCVNKDGEVKRRIKQNGKWYNL